jgi:hypothetical protein
MVTPINQRGSPLELLDEVAEEVGLVGIVNLLDTSFGCDAAAVCLGVSSQVRYEQIWGGKGMFSLDIKSSPVQGSGVGIKAEDQVAEDQDIQP